MPRNISFMLTQDQFRAKTKRVTRRLGWKNLQPGDILNGCEKCQGLKKGEKVVVMGPIIVQSVRWERLDKMLTHRTYGLVEVVLEGFPDWTPQEFVEFFCETHRVKPDVLVNRIKFDYL